MSDQSKSNPSEPIFNIPAAVVTTVGVLVLVHAVRVLVLTEPQDVEFVLAFGFIPARYGSHVALGEALPGGFAGDLWTFFTYAFIHADLTHLGVNLAWLVPFASALARRFGSWRYVLFMLTTAAVGAMAHLVSHLGALEPMIGASASVSGTMAAAIRFAFVKGSFLSFSHGDADTAARVPALPLTRVLRDPRVLGFLAIWFGVNIIFGVGSIAIGTDGGSVAWQAHIGGFLAGLVLFSLFDPVPRVDVHAADALSSDGSDRV